MLRYVNEGAARTHSATPRLDVGLRVDYRCLRKATRRDRPADTWRIEAA